MTCNDDLFIEELLSSQTVRFLDETFDNSVLLQSSIRAVKRKAKDHKLFPCDNTIKKKADRFTDSVSISNNHVSSHTTSKTASEVNKITEKHKEIRLWGLPDEIATKYESRGLRIMFDWQVECLGNAEVLHNYKNLLYSAPTSAGKTLVAEIISIKTVLERQKKVIFVLPFVSVVREKMFYFQEMFSSSGLRVEGFMGSHIPPGGFQSIHIAICTIEKANNLINQLLQEGRISILGAVVVDEFHLLGDAHRGYILELLLTKLKFITSHQDIDHIQIIGMSATLPNLPTLAGWLNAELYVTDFRPIPLHEGMIIGNKIYDRDMTLHRELAIIDDVKNDSDHIIQLCLETINENCSVLIFCSTKNWCENLCQNLASAFYNLGCSSTKSGTMLKEQLNSSKIVEVLEQLRNCPVGIDSVLKKTISFGVAFHHAGLTLDERDIIEGAFKSGAIRVLVATSTLSSGVNLPARRVIVRSPLFQNKTINILTYKQMIGRAGRMGKDDKGESILICTKADQNTGCKLMLGELEAVVSCIQGGDKFMRAILEVIASGVVSTFAEIENYARCTLLYHEEKSTGTLIKLLNDTLEYLEYSELLNLQKNKEFCNYKATALGKACLSSSLAPNDGLSLFFELQKARQCLVLENDFHLLYLVTPYSVSSQWANLDWIHLLNIWENLSITMKRVSELIGVQESFICRAVRNMGKEFMKDNKVQVYKRFYVALALQDLVNEVPLMNVAEKFKCSRGLLQSLQQSAATFAGMVTAFCRQLGWKNLELLISQFQDRLHFGIQADLIDLMQLQSLNGLRARSLHSAGIETICELASANIIDVENALNTALPFESHKKRQGETEVDTLKRNKLKNIWITGNCGLTIKEAADNLILEARNYLQWKIGVNKINWDKSNSSLPIIQKCINKNDSLCEKDTNHRIISSESNEPNLVLLDKNYSTINNTQQSKTTTEHMRISSDLVKNEQISQIELISLNCSADKSKHNVTVTKNISNSEINASLFEESWCGTDHMYQSIDKNKALPSNSLAVSGETSNNNSLLINTIGSLENAFLSTFEDEADKMTLRYSESDESLAFDMSTISLESFPCNDVFLNENKNLENFGNNFDQSSSQIKVAGDEVDIQRSDYKYIDLFVPKCGPLVNNLYSRNNKECEMIKLHYTDSFNEHNLIQLLEHLTQLPYLSMFIHFEKLQSKNQVIGSNIVGKQSFDKLRNVKPTHVSNNTELKGIAFYTEEFRCYYISSKYMEGQVFNKFQAFFQNGKTTIYVHWLKSIYLHLKSCYDIETTCKYKDISIMDWLIDSDADEKLLHKLADVYCNIDLTLAYYDEMSNNQKYSKKLNQNMESCVKAWTICQIAKKQLETLNMQYDNVCPVLDVEGRVACILADSEYCGIRVDKQFVAKLLSDVKASQDKLKTKAYKLVGYRFNLNSPKDIAKVLGLYKGTRKVSTKKSVLKAHHTPLSYLILYWRKLNTILTKSLYPLTAKAVLHTDADRIYSSYITHTSTGRVCMREPNIQNIPRIFEMPEYFLEPDKDIDLEENCDMIVFNCRKAITAASGWIFVSADYCQLEMRLLTHMCHDDKLVKIMKSKCDVFAKIAACLGNVNEENVSDELRQMAKQICYGIIYGMGTKALAEQLHVTELEASIFMDIFYNTYTAIRHFTNTIIEKCKQRGYVETLMKRRRYLPAINSVKIAERRHAERQAVNTTIQGSAADIVKSAMIAVSDSLKSHGIEQKTRLMLQMHDELIYEVKDCTCQHFIEILKSSMEGSVRLTIPLPVKIKIGSNWGEMTEINLAST